MDESRQWVQATDLGFPKSRRQYELWGELPVEPRLAVVGSRAAWTRDKAGVQRLVQRAGQAGYCLVSGGALGVDAWAHRAALAVGLPQLVVLPCTSDELYPPDHRALFLEIARRPHCGVLFSLGRGRSFQRHVFVARNEIVVRASARVVVVQSQVPSGSLWTGRRALALKRRVAVFEGSPGALALQREGATSLGKSEAPDQELRVKAWLSGQPCQNAGPVWPQHLSGLRDAFARAPGQLLCVQSCAQPLLARIQLEEAQALGLVVEQSRGQFRLVGGGLA